MPKPEEFRSPLARGPDPFECVRVMPADVPPMTSLWEALRGDFRDEWDTFLADLEATDARLAEINWRQVNPWDLITNADAGARVANGVRSFLPPECDHINPATRLTLYFVKLILDSRTEVDPFIAVRRASRYLEAGQLANIEIKRRAREHIGVHAAFLLIRVSLAGRGIESQRAEQETAQALVTIRNAVRPKLLSGVRAQLADMEAVSDRSPSGLDPVIERQVFETAVARWGQQDPFEVLAQALEGGLNFFPQAVADDLTDAVRKQRGRERIMIRLRERVDHTEREREGRSVPAPRTEPDVRAPRRPVDIPEGVMPPSGWRPDEELQLTRLLERVRADPLLRDLAEAYAECEPDADQETIAVWLGKSSRTVRALLAKARALAGFPRAPKR